MLSARLGHRADRRARGHEPRDRLRQGDRSFLAQPPAPDQGDERDVVRTDKPQINSDRSVGYTSRQDQLTRRYGPRPG
jgi:hypothetical protein